jgi:hypothetical protein
MKSETSKSSDAVAESPTQGSIMGQIDYIDPAIQKRTILKLDTVVMGCFGLMYFFANLDRNNLVSFHG